MNGLVLGLDIGIASVGVGILEKNSGKIIHTNSRIFPAATADSNKCDNFILFTLLVLELLITKVTVKL